MSQNLLKRIMNMLAALDIATGNIFGWFMLQIYHAVKNYALAVVVFTLVIKLVTMPFDFWQKASMRKNNKAMKAMKPKLDQLKEETADNPQLFYVKQRALYKEYGYSALGSCLPTIVTLVIFIVMFGGFNAMVRYQNLETFRVLESKYYEQYDGYSSEFGYGNSYSSLDNDKKAALEAEIVEGTKTVKDMVNGVLVKTYDERRDGFFWVKNIFVGDVPWSKVVPDYGVFSGTGGGFLKIGNLNIKGVDRVDYERITQPISDSYGNQVNGYLILPLLCFALQFLMTKLNPQQNQMQQQSMMPTPRGQDPETAQRTAQTSNKVMMFMMPAMMLVFGLFYSAAFSLYIIVSSVFSAGFNFIYNSVAKKKDAVEEEEVKETTYLRKSELDALRKKEEKERVEKEQKEKDEKARKILEKTQKDIEKL